MIDIIIPIYNANKYLDRVISSIEKQTYTDYKVYIIDANSTEQYNLDKYFNINITYIKLDKQTPPGLTRQVGIDNSNSKYILFIDQDDELIKDNSLELLINNINDYDIASAYEYFEQANINMMNQISLHAKLYSRNFLNKHNIKFNDYLFHEDLYFNNKCYLNNAKINTINEIIYYYHDNKDSIINTTHDIEINRLEYIFKTIHDLKKEIPISKNNQTIYKEFIFNNYDYILRILNELDKNEITLLKEYIQKYDNEDEILMSSKSNIELKNKINEIYNTK